MNKFQGSNIQMGIIANNNTADSWKLLRESFTVVTSLPTTTKWQLCEVKDMLTNIIISSISQYMHVSKLKRWYLAHIYTKILSILAEFQI